ncbi:MAG: hypothetical protein MUE41_14685 [Gemmatimonadaceae bacterium]|jgi:hypothetical protein|nr:hypothetical protein [Gemmatimonadaceae bacterium]
MPVDPIVSQPLRAIHPDGREEQITIRLDAPQRVAGGDWSCACALTGPEGYACDSSLHGADGLQALCLALHRLEHGLRTFLADGGRLRFVPAPGDVVEAGEADADWPIDSYFIGLTPRPAPLPVRDDTPAAITAWIDAWNAPAESRAAALDAAIVCHTRYLDPHLAEAVDGRDAIAEHIARFRSMLPHVLEVTRGPDRHHGTSRLSWRLRHPETDALLSTGQMIAQADATGERLAWIAHFVDG